MKRNNTIVSNNTSRSQNSEPNANFPQGERVGHSKLAILTILIVMLFLLTLFPQATANQNPTLILALSIGLGVGICALLLTWRGLVRIAGILTLIVVYTIGTLTLLHYPAGLTASDLYLLDLTIIPDILVLAFFSANSLLPVVCINAIQASAILLFGHHDSTITHLLQTTPIEIFSHIYVIQIITAIVLYLWASSTKHALVHTERAEEKECQKQELEKKRQLDDGIQQILQTHVAVANGDLNARAPLLKDHELWQVTSALNNLIARYQSLSHAERKLRQRLWEENKRSTDQHQIHPQDTGELAKLQQATGELLKLRQATGEMPKLQQATGELLTFRQVTGEMLKLRQTTGEMPKLQQATGEIAKLKQETGELPKLERDGDSSGKGPSGSLRHTRSLSNNPN